MQTKGITMSITYPYFRGVRQVAATVASVSGIAAILHFVVATPGSESLKTICNETMILLWILIPPLWFFFEYWALDQGCIAQPTGEDKETFLKSTKDYADYASKIWAAVVAILILLFEVNTRK
jgi:hypothetical protein